MHRLKHWDRSTHTPGTIIVARRRVRRGKGVAIQSRVDARRADLVDHLKVAHVDVDVGLDGQLSCGPHDGESGSHWARATCEAVTCVKKKDKDEIQAEQESATGPNESSRVKNQDATSRAVKGELDGRKTTGSKVRIRASSSNRVQVERQLEPRAGHGDRLGQLPVHAQAVSICRLTETKPPKKIRTVTTLTRRGTR